MSELREIMSHDLNNFLQVAMHYSKLGLKDYDQMLASSGLEKIDRALSLIHKLVEDVNKIEALNSDKLILHPEVINLNAILEESLSIFETRLKEKNLNLSLKIDTSIRINGDRRSLLNSVFNNIISNAIKFSEGGTTISCTASVLADKRIQVVIKDQGIGIPPAIVDDLFDPLKKTCRRGTKNERGTGFGLPLVKAFLDAHGATIDIKSQGKNAYTSEQGTTVMMVFPAI